MGSLTFHDWLRTDVFDGYFQFELIHNNLQPGIYILNDTSFNAKLGKYRFFLEGQWISTLSEEHNGLGYFRVAERKTHCMYWGDGEYGEGKLSLNYVSGAIVSGNFEFTIAAPGCDTLRVTEGRFDLKLP